MSLRLALALAIVATASPSPAPSAPASKPAAPRRTAAAPGDATPAPRLVPPAPFSVPTPVERTLSNGLRVAVFQNDRRPVVDVQLLVPAGAAAEPVGSEGIAWITAEMLLHGTTSRAPRAYAAELERAGGRIVASSSRDYSMLSGAFLTRDLDAGLELMSDAVVYPIFAAGELDAVRAQALRSYGQIMRVPATAADELVWSLAWDAQPYGRTRFGLPEALGRMESDSVRTFWARHWKPGGSFLAIVGDVDPERAFRAAEESFGRWESGAALGVPAARVSPPARTRIRIHDRATARAEIRIGALGPLRGSGDGLAVACASAMIGGSLAPAADRVRFGREVRSGWTTLRDGGLLTVSASAPAESVGTAVRRLLADLRALQRPVATADLARVKRYLRNVQTLGYDAPASVGAAWAAAGYYGQALERPEDYAALLEAITPEQVAEAAGRWLDPDHLFVLVIGPADAMRSRLEPLGDVELAGEGPAAQAAAPPSPPAPKPRATLSAAALQRGRELVRKALAAHGGAAKLKAIRDSRVTGDLTLDIGGQKLEGHLIQVRKDPDRMLYLTEIAGVSTRQVLMGDRGWQSAGADTTGQPMDSVTVAAMRHGFASDLPHLLAAAADPQARVWFDGTEPWEDGTASRLVVETPNQPSRTLFLDRTRSIVLGFEEGGDVPGAPITRRTFSDFRAIGGILWPYRELRLLNGEPVMQVQMRDVKLNAGVEDSVFGSGGATSR